MRQQGRQGGGCRSAALTVLALTVVAALVVVAAFVVSDYLASRPTQDSCTAKAGGLTTELEVEQSENAALISALAVRRGMPARAATIAVATAFQESDIVNVDYGDRDSLGLFQQRPSMGWGEPEQLLDPYYATNTFYDHLQKVDGYESAPIAEAAQAVQRSADGGAYAQHEVAARALASSLTGYSPGAFSCVLVDTPTVRDAAGLRAELHKAFGQQQLDRSGAAVRVAVDPAVPSNGWAVSHWTVAHAKRFGVVRVVHDGQAWNAEDSQAGWSRTRGAPSDQVRIEFASDSAQ